MLTLEDVNSVNIGAFHDYYILDTANINKGNFNNVSYDFVICSRTIDSATNSNVFTFEIHNSLWCGGYHVKNNDDEFILDDLVVSYNPATKTLMIITEEDTIKLVLELCNVKSFRFGLLEYMLISPLINHFNYKQWNTEYLGEALYIPDNISEEIVCVYHDGYDSAGFYGVLEKIPLIYDLDTTLVIGRENKVYLNADIGYIDLFDFDLYAELLYDDLIIPIQYDENVGDYCFNIDLSDKYDANSIHLKLKLYESKFTVQTINEHVMKCKYPTASNYAELHDLIYNNVTNIEVVDDITLEDTLVINHDCYLKADSDVSIDLSSNGFIIDAGVRVKVNNLDFSNGVNVFKQNSSSELILHNCNFNNNSISDTGKGSVVFANFEDVKTELTNCNIFNSPHSVFTGGELLVNNVKALYNRLNGVDTDYSMFATVYDGETNIINSTFDIDYNTDTYCANEENIGLAQSLISIGENTVFNEVQGDKIKGDNSLPFFQAPLNNRCHVYCKYYYPQIEECVITSPLTNNEDRNVCYTVLGTDWVYKMNTQITKILSELENNTRIINWEDI